MGKGVCRWVGGRLGGGLGGDQVPSVVAEEVEVLKRREPLVIVHEYRVGGAVAECDEGLKGLAGIGCGN